LSRAGPPVRRDPDFQPWLNRVQLVADRVGIVGAWLGDGIAAAVALYEKALESHDWQTAEGFADRRATRENPYGHGNDVKVMTI